MRHLPLYDPLTGLPNSTLCMDHIAQAVARVDRYGGYAALLRLDLDRFRPLNETLGSDVCNEVLRQVAERIRNCLREVDSAARFGGDEFVLVLQEIKDRAEAEAVAARVLEALESPYACHGELAGPLGASIGVSLCPEHGRSVDLLLKKAEQAMRRVKGLGGGGVAVWADLTAA